ncbi:MAG: UTP--glucose-phosphate uridylyltransferase [Pseudonocardiales bacterium]|nr:UTP--glucose-phosphate uridylyltransferase [Pseudonocardiales bacterium]
MTRPRVRKALIPAAGRGTRFLPLTKAVPKELAPIVTTPALELVVAEAAGVGMTDVLLVVGPGKTAIADYFRPNADLEAALEAKGDDDGVARVRRPTQLAHVDFVEQKDPRGLGDAVGHGEEFAADEPIAVLLPDDLVDDRDSLLGPMLDVYAEHGGVVLGLLDVGPVEISKYGCVVPAEGADPTADVVELVDLVEKPKAEDAPSTLAIIGRYVLPPEIFAALRDTTPGAGGEIQLTDAMLALCRAGTPVHGVVFRGRRYDTGDRLGYVKAVVQLAVRHPDIGSDFRAWLREYEPEDG